MLEYTKTECVCEMFFATCSGSLLDRKTWKFPRIIQKIRELLGNLTVQENGLLVTLHVVFCRNSACSTVSMCCAYTLFNTRNPRNVLASHLDQLANGELIKSQGKTALWINLYILQPFAELLLPVVSAF